MSGIPSLDEIGPYCVVRVGPEFTVAELNPDGTCKQLPGLGYRYPSIQYAEDVRDELNSAFYEGFRCGGEHELAEQAERLAQLEAENAKLKKQLGTQLGAPDPEAVTSSESRDTSELADQLQKFLDHVPWEAPNSQYDASKLRAYYLISAAAAALSRLQTAQAPQTGRETGTNTNAGLAR